MTNIIIEDQKDKNGVVIDQIAHFRELKRHHSSMNKAQTELVKSELEEELSIINEVLAAFTV